MEKKIEDKITEKLEPISVPNIENKIKIHVEQTLEEQKELENK